MISLSFSLQSLSGSLCLSVCPSLTLSFFLAHSLSVSLCPRFLSLPPLSLKASIQSLQSHWRAAKMSNLSQPYESGVKSRDESDQRWRSELKEKLTQNTQLKLSETQKAHAVKVNWPHRGVEPEPRLREEASDPLHFLQGLVFHPIRAIRYHRWWYGRYSDETIHLLFYKVHTHTAFFPFLLLMLPYVHRDHEDY